MLHDLYKWIDAGHGDVLFWGIVIIIIIESMLKWRKG
jgi:hypothetical protein